MDELVLPCSRCAPTAPASVDGESIRCLGCGHVRPFVRQPLYLVTGPPASGKTSVIGQLHGYRPEVVTFDTDLFGPWSHPDWSAWASSWLLVAHALAQSHLQALLVGYGLSKSKAAGLPPYILLGPLRALNLHVQPDILRERLRTRTGYDVERIERKLVSAQELRADADDVIDVTGLSEVEVGTAVRSWIDREVLRHASYKEIHNA